MGDPTIDHHIFLSIPLSQDLESDIIFINGRPSFIHLVTHSFIQKTVSEPQPSTLCYTMPWEIKRLVGHLFCPEGTQESLYQPGF